MEIHQVVVSATPGDAVTNSALECRSLLRQACRSEVFAYYIHPELHDDVLPLQHYGSRSTDITRDVLLFHASIGAPEVFAFLRRRPERLGIIYHNISPAPYFYPYDPAFAGLLEGGRRELRLLRDRAEITLADSQFNAGELIEMGYADVRVSPLIVDVSRMQRVAPAPATQELLSGIEGPKYLFVGQMLPHKRPDLLLKSFHALSTYIEPDAHLFMVGAGRLPNYLEVVHQFVKELNLHRAYLTGPVSDEDLAAFYQGCDVFVTPSEHEGFCIPLLEAMAFELPIVARDFAAIPETLGGAGLLLDAEATVLGLAEGMHELIANRELVETYRRLGKDRLEAFDADRSRATFLSHIAELV